MKRKLFALVMALTLVGLFAPAAAEARVDVSVGVSFFQGELSPYGRWVTVADYGEVWCPRGVYAGWQPYLNGEWLWTDYGWTWVSYDPWGGDPYHYGTWVVTADWGWVWVPGTVWAPAWVTWCWTGDSVGWAPVPPSFSIGLVGYSGPAFVAPARSYVFVPTRSFVGVDVMSARVDPARNATFLAGAHKTTSFAVSGGVVRTGGPPLANVQKATGSRVRVSSIGQAKARPVPIATAARGSRTLSVVAPARERDVLKAQAESRGGRQAAQTVKETTHLSHPSQPSRELSKPPARKAEPPHETRAQAPARKPEPPHEMKAQAPARNAGPPHEMKAQAPSRRPEPRPETKLDPSVRRQEPPHETKAQAPARRPEPPHATQAQAPLRRPEPPHATQAQAPPRRPEPPHAVQAQAPAKKKPVKPEGPGS